MSRSTVAGAVLGGASVLSIAGLAGYKALSGPEYAEVVNVEPIKQTEKKPEQVCQEVQVTHRKPVKDEHRIVGTVLGGVVGGVVGHQIGAGRGKDVATVAGAAAGGYAGNRIQKHMQDTDTYATTEQRCKTVTHVSEKVVGYDVRYRLDGQLGKVRMEQKPGERIPVKDGKLVLTDDAARPASK
ncbi:MAG TPA: glycine zipper 2TM domain-containing protein [Burkholderiales bacterium]|nr:glycine zipper 2TM domain-containing protein [Burkholderiales bacterium]